MARLVLAIIKCPYRSPAHILDKLDTNGRLVSQEKVMQPWWGQETLKLPIKQVDKGEISTLTRR